MGRVSGWARLIFDATVDTSFSLNTWIAISVARPSGKPKNSIRSSLRNITRSLVRISDSDRNTPTTSNATPMFLLSMRISSSPIPTRLALETPEPIAHASGLAGSDPSSRSRFEGVSSSSPRRV